MSNLSGAMPQLAQGRGNMRLFSKYCTFRRSFRIWSMMFQLLLCIVFIIAVQMVREFRSINDQLTNELNAHNTPGVHVNCVQDIRPGQSTTAPIGRPTK